MVRRLPCFVAKYMGDGVLVYFGYPQAHEDDAERAVRGAGVGRDNAEAHDRRRSSVGAPDVADTFKTTYLSQMTKPIDALKTIARYVEAKKPKTLAEAEHMLDLISVMADETILDEDAAESSLAKGLISKPFFP
jgi:hypothetical protein